MREAVARVALAALAACALLSALAPPNRAVADAGVVTFHAARVTADLARADLVLSGDVELAYQRYRLRASSLAVRLDHDSVAFAGDARLALCPCPHPGLELAAASGHLDATGDVLLRAPRVLFEGRTVLVLPVLWVRPPDRIGVLPPIIELRGADGVLLGSGVRLPWSSGDGNLDALDLVAGGYTAGGVELGAHLVTTSTDTRAAADLVRGTRVALTTDGVFEPAKNVGVAFGADAIRGDRALSGTVGLEPATRPFDTARAEVSWATGAGSANAIVAGGVDARAFRGLGPIAAGPNAGVAFGGPIATTGSWSADASGAVLADGASFVSLGRAATATEIDTHPGPFDLRTSVAARARFARDGSADPSTEAAAQATANLELPFERRFASSDASGDLVHTITPGLRLRAALASDTGSFFAPLSGVVPGAAWLGAAGVASTLGRSSGSVLRVELVAGAVGDGATAEGLAHARLEADTRFAALSSELAATSESSGGASGAGVSWLGRLRLGERLGPWLRLNAAAQAGAERAIGRAREVAWGAWAALPGDELAYMTASGLTGGAEASVPVVRGLRVASRVDADVTAPLVLAVRGSALYRHPCGCFALGATAGARRGRDGVDLALSVDLAPSVR